MKAKALDPGFRRNDERKTDSPLSPPSFFRGMTPGQRSAQMLKQGTRRQSSRMWMLRGMILGLVVVLHIVAVLFLLMPVGIEPMALASGASSALQVRLIEVPTKGSVVQQRAQPPTRSTNIPARSFRPVVKRASAVVTPIRMTESPRRAHTESPSLMDKSIQITWSPPPAAMKYASGGELLRGNTLGRMTLHLPGAGHTIGAPHFKMIDPKTQGLVAGFIHYIARDGHLPDPQCFELDKWRGMTLKQRGENGVSEAEMEKISNNYGNYNCQHLYTPHPWQR